MRSRGFREGTVGLLILTGLGLFGFLVAWVQGVGIGQQRYRVTMEFTDAQGVQVGSVLRYRGVQIGKVTAVRPGSQLIEIEAEIDQPELRIPSDSIVTVQTAALLGDVVMDVLPQSVLTEVENLPRPIDPACNPDVIICEGSELQGVETADFADLIQSTYELAQIFSDPLLIAALEEAAMNAGRATTGLTGLTTNFTNLTDSLNNEIDNLSNTITTMGTAATEIQNTAVTARNILESNRGALDATLGNFSQAGQDLMVLFDDLNPIVSEVADGNLLKNLETLTNNLRVASSQLRVATAALNDPSNVQVLQETLDSARVTFQNAQKITTDLEELTGDAYLREDVRRLLEGFGGLFTAAHELEQEIEVVQRMNQTIAGEPLFSDPQLGSTDWLSWHQFTPSEQGVELPAETLDGDENGNDKEDRNALVKDEHVSNPDGSNADGAAEWDTSETIEDARATWEADAAWEVNVEWSSDREMEADY